MQTLSELSFMNLVITEALLSVVLAGSRAFLVLFLL